MNHDADTLSIKHGVLENGPFIGDFPMRTHVQLGDFPLPRLMTPEGMDDDWGLRSTFCARQATALSVHERAV